MWQWCFPPSNRAVFVAPKSCPHMIDYMQTECELGEKWRSCLALFLPLLMRKITLRNFYLTFSFSCNTKIGPCDHLKLISCRGQWDCYKELGLIRITMEWGWALLPEHHQTSFSMKEEKKLKATLKATTCWVLVTNFCYPAPGHIPNLTPAPGHIPNLDSSVECISPTK